MKEIIENVKEKFEDACILEKRKKIGKSMKILRNLEKMRIENHMVCFNTIINTGNRSHDDFSELCHSENIVTNELCSELAALAVRLRSTNNEQNASKLKKYAINLDPKDTDAKRFIAKSHAYHLNGIVLQQGGTATLDPHVYFEGDILANTFNHLLNRTPVYPGLLAMQRVLDIASIGIQVESINYNQIINDPSSWPYSSSLLIPSKNIRKKQIWKWANYIGVDALLDVDNQIKMIWDDKNQYSMFDGFPIDIYG